MVIIGFSKIKKKILPHHLQETGQRRPVEAVELSQLLDPVLVEAFTALVQTGRGAGFTTGAVSFQLRHHPLDRATRDELGNGKGNQHDPEDRRYHEEKTFKNIIAHLSPLRE